MAEFYGNTESPMVEGLTEQTIIGEKEVEEASAILEKYRQGKANLEARVIEDEEWYKLRHWEVMRRNKQTPKNGAQPEPASAWLFNAILNKHADAMDNYPEPIVLPREKSDIASAKELQEVVPVIMEQNQFEETYSDNWWKKLKDGTSVTGIFWNSEKENGLGDIEIKSLDLLRVFWEAGITDIQKSRNLFITDLVDTDILDDMYPEYKGKMSGGALDVSHYIYDDNVDTTDKSLVVDWYYKRKAENGRTILHYCKFVNNCVLYASENDPDYRETGYYDHGLYPVVFDVMFPEEGTPTGFGYVAICKNPQMYIDKLDGYIIESAMMGSKKRFFVSASTNVNEQEFLDWNKPLVHCEGAIDDRGLKEIVLQPLSGHYLNVLEMKIDELKETSANRDVNSGQTGKGVTAASAISALQEAGNKTSRDMISASYRCHNQIVSMVIELIRQFYDEQRSFRITKPNDIATIMASMFQEDNAVEASTDYQFIDFDNSKIKPQVVGEDAMGNPLFRKPIFDLKIKAQKKNPFSRMEQNERAKELYAMGFFNPQKAQESLIALDMMDFEGIQEVKDKVMQGQTLFNMVQELAGQVAMLTGQVNPMMGEPTAPQESGGGDSQLTNAIMQAQQPKMGYQERLARRSTPHMDTPSDRATPR